MDKFTDVLWIIVWCIVNYCDKFWPYVRIGNLENSTNKTLIKWYQVLVGTADLYIWEGPFAAELSGRSKLIWQNYQALSGHSGYLRFHDFHVWIRASKLLRLPCRILRRAEQGIQCMPCFAQCAEERWKKSVGSHLAAACVERGMRPLQWCCAVPAPCQHPATAQKTAQAEVSIFCQLVHSVSYVPF